MAAAKPRELVPGRVWEVPCGLPMEAFWCVHGPPQVTEYNFRVKNCGRGHARTSKKAALAALQQHHALSRTHADSLVLTSAGHRSRPGTVVWSSTYTCKGDGNCVGPGGGKCPVTVQVTATREQVLQGVWSVLLWGDHVPTSTAPVPPKQLKMSRLALNWALDKANCGMSPGIVLTYIWGIV